MSTIPHYKGSPAVTAIETCCAVFFSIEVILRTYVATQSPKRMMLLDPSYWIDVLCIVPFYAEIFVSVANAGGVVTIPTWLRVLSLFRLLRVMIFPPPFAIFPPPLVIFQPPLATFPPPFVILPPPL